MKETIYRDEFIFRERELRGGDLWVTLGSNAPSRDRHSAPLGIEGTDRALGSVRFNQDASLERDGSITVEGYFFRNMYVRVELATEPWVRTQTLEEQIQVILEDRFREEQRMIKCEETRLKVKKV